MTMFEVCCACCKEPILDKFVTRVLDKPWHESCVRCADCGSLLNEKCFAKHDRIFCREDFYRRYGPRCSGCQEIVSPTDMVRKARDRVFHLNCFTCVVCRKQLLTGEKLYVLRDDSFVCKEDYLSGNLARLQQATQDFEDEDDDYEYDEEDPYNFYHSQSAGYFGDSTSHYARGSYNDNHSSIPMGGGDLGMHERDANIDSEDGYDDPDGKKKEKRRGPRTTIKAQQLEVLKTTFSQTPKPTRHIREQLAKETGLPMRVIQVWFQNRRSKERRLKQMSNRAKYFVGGRKVRGSFGFDIDYYYDNGIHYPGPHHPTPPFPPSDFFANGYHGLKTEQPLPMSVVAPTFTEDTSIKQDPSLGSENVSEINEEDNIIMSEAKENQSLNKTSGEDTFLQS